MRSKASIRGHPLHPALIALPIGLLPGALLVDIAWLLQGDAWLPAAALLTIAGTLTLLVGALPGFVDYFSIVPRRGNLRRYANWHLSLGLVLAVLYIASSLIHWAAWMQGARPSWLQAALVLNVVGAVGLGIQGYIGGQMVYHGRLAVVEDSPIMREPAGQERRPEPGPTRA